MRIALRVVALLAVGLIARSTVLAQSSYPMLMSLKPLAAQIGTTAECELEARYNLHGAFQVYVSGVGVTGEVVPPPEPAKPPEKKEPPKPAAPAAKAPDKKPAAPAAESKPTAPKPTAAPSDKKPLDPKAAEPKATEKKPAGKKPDEKSSNPPVQTAAEKPNLPKIKLRFKVAADALPGVRDIRVATPQGVSTLGQLVVVRDPVHVEGTANDTADKAEAVKLPAVICGAIERNEDLDLFRFEAKAGQTLVFNVRSHRCEDRIHDLQVHADPIITIRDEHGTVVALNDNHFAADPLIVHRFERAGAYTVEIRDVRYQGNNFWQYAIEANDRPLVTNVFPLGVSPEKPTPLELIGPNVPAGARATLTVPGNVPEGMRYLSLGAKTPFDPVPVYVHRLPETREADQPHAEAAQAQPVPAPTGINARIAAPGEVDYYAFEAKKGERYSFEIVARRHQSQLEPFLTLYDGKGTRLVENDDMTVGPSLYGDSQIENWAAPADGRYVLELRDLHGRGGPDFVYFLAITRAEPYFLLDVDTDKTNLPAGLGGAILVRAYRKNGFTGEIQLAIAGLPPGVKATCGKILADGQDGCIVLQSEPGAKLALANVVITGVARFPVDGKDRSLTVTARNMQETYMPGGGRGLMPVDIHSVATCEPLDITAVKISPNRVTLKPGESKSVEVTLERAAGFDKNVTLDVTSNHLERIYASSLPPGVTVEKGKSKLLVTGKVSQGTITLKAAPDTKPVVEQVVPVIANVAINFVMKMSYGAEPLLLTVEKKP